MTRPRIGDLVRYALDNDECENHVPGLVVGFEPTSSEHPHICVQWVDWAVGEIAVEGPEAVVVVSKA
jgi:hypothetical protein